LIVEDDRDIRVMLGELFARHGYEVELAADGADAINKLEEIEHPRAILVDLMMPGIVGEELLEYLSEDDRLSDVPVAIVSAVPKRAPPGYTVFRKPVKGRALLDFVRRGQRA
jgi:CheY-like chemotaxis protein